MHPSLRPEKDDMHFSLTRTAIAIGLLFICTYSLGQERSVSTGQRYVMHVPEQVKFGLLPTPVKDPNAPRGKEDVESLMFVAEASSGMTIQFETESKRPLQLTVGSGNWWAGATSDVTGSTSEFQAKACRVEASTFRPGRTTLQLDVATPDVGSAAKVITIVVTFVAH